MTEYRLKDQALQEKLCALDKSFAEALQHAVEKAALYGEDAVLVSFGPGAAIHVDLFLTEIEAIPEYDPHVWNEYPSVMPPRGVRMRVEHGRHALREGPEEIRPARLERRTCATWDGDRWVDEKGCGFANLRGLKKLEYVRFRPWEDEE